MSRIIHWIAPKDPVPKEWIADTVVLCEGWLPQAMVHEALHREIGHWIQATGSRLEIEKNQSVEMIDKPYEFHEAPEGVMLGEAISARFEREFSSILEKDECLSAAGRALESQGVSRGCLENLRFVLDEFYTNAVFNAPGNVWSERKPNAALPGGKRAKLVVASSENWLWAGVQDPFGSYSIMRALSRLLVSYLEGVGAVIQTEVGGAGIGTRLSLEKVVNLTVQVRSGESTWVCAVLPRKRKSDRGTLQHKNLHLQVIKGGKMGQFQFQEKREGAALRLELQGHIDEDARFEKLPLAGIQTVDLQLSAVTAINSCGVREWIKWLKGMQPGAQLSLAGCQKALVDQFNMVDGFLPAGARIHSFFVPYFCEHCDSATSVLLTEGKDFIGKGAQKKLPTLAETQTCPNCKKTAELDVIGTQYTRFLNRLGD